MALFKDPSFQDRVGRAAAAKQKALEQFRSKPPLDEKVLAERKAASMKREAAKAEKAAAKKAAEEAAAQAAAEAKAAEAAAKAAVPPPPTEAERKAARDARYAARKNRR